MDNYPECEKMQEVQEKSQAIGSFLDWVFNEKELSFGKYLNEEEIEEIKYENDCDDIQEWMLRPVRISINEILAEYFNIDLKKVEEEKQQMLEKIRSAQ